MLDRTDQILADAWAGGRLRVEDVRAADVIPGDWLAGTAGAAGTPVPVKLRHSAALITAVELVPGHAPGAAPGADPSWNACLHSGRPCLTRLPPEERCLVIRGLALPRTPGETRLQAGVPRRWHMMQAASGPLRVEAVPAGEAVPGDWPLAGYADPEGTTASLLLLDEAVVITGRELAAGKAVRLYSHGYAVDPVGLDDLCLIISGLAVPRPAPGQGICPPGPHGGPACPADGSRLQRVLFGSEHVLHCTVCEVSYGWAAGLACAPLGCIPSAQLKDAEVPGARP